MYTHGNNHSDTDISITAMDVTVPGKVLVKALTLALPAGSWLAVLGRNGSGKTRALETLCQLHGAQPVQVYGQNIAALPSRQRAQLMTLVTQHQNDAFDNAVIDNVMLGGYAHASAWQAQNATALERAQRCLANVGLHDITRSTRTLSGGERQRVAIAQALMQDTPLLLLDEPLSHQDPAHARLVLQLLARERDNGKTLISSMHDVNTALHFATHALLLDGSGDWQFGSVAQLLTTQHVSALYDTPMMQVDTPRGPWFVPDLTG